MDVNLMSNLKQACRMKKDHDSDNYQTLPATRIKPSLPPRPIRSMSFTAGYSSSVTTNTFTKQSIDQLPTNEQELNTDLTHPPPVITSDQQSPVSSDGEESQDSLIATTNIEEINSEPNILNTQVDQSCTVANSNEVVTTKHRPPMPTRPPPPLTRPPRPFPPPPPSSISEAKLARKRPPPTPPLIIDSRSSQQFVPHSQRTFKSSEQSPTHSMTRIPPKRPPPPTLSPVQVSFGATGTATGGTDSATGGIDSATGGIDNATGGTTGNATGGTTGNATGGIDNVTGGTTGNATGGIDNATGGIDSATGSATGGIDNATGSTDSVTGATGSVTGDSTEDFTEIDNEDRVNHSSLKLIEEESETQPNTHSEDDVINTHFQSRKLLGKMKESIRHFSKRRNRTVHGTTDETPDQSPRSWKRMLSMRNLPKPDSTLENQDNSKYPEKLSTGVVDPLLVQCVAYLNKEEVLKEPGLFRIPGDLSVIKKLRARFIAGEFVDLSDILDPNVVTGLLKVYFREKPYPLISNRLCLNRAVMSARNHDVDDFKQVLEDLDDVTLASLRMLSELFRKITEYSEENHMTSGILATSCAPSFFPNTPPSNANSLVKFITDNCEDLFSM